MFVWSVCNQWSIDVRIKLEQNNFSINSTDCVWGLQRTFHSKIRLPHAKPSSLKTKLLTYRCDTLLKLCAHISNEGTAAILTAGVQFVWKFSKCKFVAIKCEQNSDQTINCTVWDEFNIPQHSVAYLRICAASLANPLSTRTLNYTFHVKVNSIRHSLVHTHVCVVIQTFAKTPSWTRNVITTHFGYIAPLCISKCNACHAYPNSQHFRVNDKRNKTVYRKSIPCHLTDKFVRYFFSIPK